MEAEALQEMLAGYVADCGLERFSEQEAASGQCKQTAFDLCAWLEAQGHTASVLNLSEPRGFDRWKAARFWQGKMFDFATHYTVRVGELSADLTARQFDPEAPFPAVLPLDELRLSWRVAYDTSEPLSAGSLWSG